MRLARLDLRSIERPRVWPIRTARGCACIRSGWRTAACSYAWRRSRVSAGGGGLGGLVHCIHASRTAAALVMTGGGTGVIPMLLRRPGGSRTVLDIAVPYSSAAVAAYLGEPPKRATSAATAEAMARRAFERACDLRLEASIPVVGLGATAALATEPRAAGKRPDARGHIRRRPNHRVGMDVPAAVRPAARSRKPVLSAPSLQR